MSTIWAVDANEGDLELEFRRATEISKGLKSKKGVGKFQLQEEKRQICFEEFREIQ